MKDTSSRALRSAREAGQGDDPLAGLERLTDAAMAPCALCGRQLLETGLPVFFRIEGKRCGIDAQEVRRHVGLAMQFGGGAGGLALAGVMGPGCKPVVVMAAPPVFNVCATCARSNTLENVLLVAAEDEGEGK
jgi:hypothetical protein